MIQAVENKKKWEEFMGKVKPPTFLHSWAWGEFNQAMGTKIFRMGMYEGNTLIGLALILKITARRGAFLFCPHGPIFSENADKEMGLEALSMHLKKLAQEEHCAFIRISPILTKEVAHEKIFTKLGFRPAPVHMMHPELGWILNIQPSEEALLKNMRKTTRYCIRKAEKDGVTIQMSAAPSDIDKFWQVYKATVDRQNFTPFSKEYLSREIAVFGVKDMKDESFDSPLCEAVFFFALYNQEIIATAIIVFYGNSAFYHHGASIPKYPKITAPYLLQWAVIQEARRRGCELYNFWGVVPEELSRHPWAGLSLFKRGFGGNSQEYVHAQDYVINQKYWLNWTVERVRKWKRGL